ncbi:MAG: isoamylase N-terminal protein [Pseudonocardiales bacterium]|nr:isoamylase N-terminal protein [Pseudonocardiales bacterium]
MTINRRADDATGSTIVIFSLSQNAHEGPVSVVGSFNDWTPGQHRLEPQDDGTLVAEVVTTGENELHFRYLGSGGAWFDDDDADEITAAGSVLFLSSSSANVSHGSAAGSDDGPADSGTNSEMKTAKKAEKKSEKKTVKDSAPTVAASPPAQTKSAEPVAGDTAGTPAASVKHRTLEEAAAAGPLAANPADTSDPAANREAVASKDDGVIPKADNDLDPDRTPANREKAIAADETVAGVNMSASLTN